MTVTRGEPATYPIRTLRSLFLLLGFSAGLPLAMYTTVLSLRLAREGVDIALIGFFAWIGLVPTIKFLWAPLLDRIDVPGFARVWGRRRGWIMLSQLGIAASLAAMAFVGGRDELPLLALFAVGLAFWTTTLEIAADGWRIALAPEQAAQAPLVTANLWGYRTAMVAAGSGAVWVAARADWTTAYLAVAAAALLPFPLLVAMPGDGGVRRRLAALVTGIATGAVIIAVATGILAAIGWSALDMAARAGVGADTNVTPFVIAIALAPFLLLAAFLPAIRRMQSDAPALRSATIGPYVDIFWRYGLWMLVVLAFVSIYRMGDVLALTLNHPMWNAKGYGLGVIAVADGAVSLGASLVGVGLGGWAAARWPIGRALLAGAAAAAVGNAAYAWLWTTPLGAWRLYTAVALDMAGNAIAGTVFVVWLSLLVNPRYPAAQYAFLSGFAFLLPRLIAGASGGVQKAIGYDGFFLIAAGASLIAALMLPAVLRTRPRAVSSPLRSPAGRDP